MRRRDDVIRRKKAVELDRGAKTGQVPVPLSADASSDGMQEAGSGVTPGQALVPAQTVIPQPLSLCPVPARVLVIGDAATRRTVIERISGLVIRGASALDTNDALAQLADQTFDLVLVATSGPWLESVERIMASNTDAAVIAVVPSTMEATLPLAIDAMQAGAADLISAETPADELATRMRGALQRARKAQHGRERIERLRKLCKNLNHARQEVSKQVGSLCSDMATAYQELADRMTHVATASEFNGLIRQELDLESLLRVALEYVLAKSGPTNAAVFLPATSGEYTLGAYVNYDSPRETAEVLLDHLAGVIAPRFESCTRLVHLSKKAELNEALGDKASWIGDSELVVLPCHHDGECLAVVALFRDRHAAFPETLLPLLQCVADQFGRQLARVIHVHHRHLPKHKWGSPGDTGDADNGPDDIDLAA
jgi:FixJ family two-component response regulator